jgi:lipoyl(octanoyl) transferase
MITHGHTSGRGRLQVHLHGSLDFEAVLHLQRKLVYQLSEPGEGAALILCEHSPIITVGRHGSAGQISGSLDEFAARRWPVRWVARGGGVILHLPGQLAIYPVLPLARLNLDLDDYMRRLHQIIVTVLHDFSVDACTQSHHAGVWVGSRLIAAIGVAVRHGITTFGASLNIDPDLLPYRLLKEPMTSLVRERRGPLRTAMVRERLVEQFRDGFGFADVDLIFPKNVASGGCEPPVGATKQGAYTPRSP